MLTNKISIIIPTFRRAHLLPEAISCVLNQTFSNTEIIVVDDNTPLSNARYETEQVLANYIHSQNIQYVQHEENKGGAAARNTGIYKAKGDFIAFLDDDDSWLPTKLEAQIQCYKSTSPDTGLVYTGHQTVDMSSGSITTVSHKLKGDVLNQLFKRNDIGTTSSILCRKSFLFEAGLFDERLPARQDIDLYIRMAQICRFDYVDKPLVIFRNHRGERISKSVIARREAFRIMYKKYWDIFKTSPKAHSNFLQRYARELLKHGEAKMAGNLLKKGIKRDPFNYRLLGIYIKSFIFNFLRRESL